MIQQLLCQMTQIASLRGCLSVTAILLNSIVEHDWLGENHIFQIVTEDEMNPILSVWRKTER